MNTVCTMLLMSGKRLSPYSVRGILSNGTRSNIRTRIGQPTTFHLYNNNSIRFYSSEPVKKTTNEKKAKEPLVQRIKHEINHYVNGTKLLGYEIKISTKLLIKLVQGYELSRRESNQLKRTMGDVFRLVPFSAFVIIPFAELLLPIALKFFPNLLPSTYESGKQKQQKTTKLIEIRQKTSNFIHETLEENQLINYNAIETAEKKKTFYNFFKKIYNSDEKEIFFTHNEIRNIARMFKNDTVLDNLSRPQLMAMSKFMSLRPFGNDNILRYQIRYQLKNIINDDKVIDYEGIDNLTKEELYQACVSRGMRAYGVPIEELKNNLQIWLELRLKEKIPSVLMVLSSTFTFGGLADHKLNENSHLKIINPTKKINNSQTTYDNLLDLYYDGILHVLSSIPDPVYNVAKLDVSESKTIESPEVKITEQVRKLEEEAKIPAPAHTPAPADAPAPAPTSATITPASIKKVIEKNIGNTKPVEADDQTGNETSTDEKQKTTPDDSEFKLQVLKEQEEMIKQEAEEAKKRKNIDQPISDNITLDKDDTPTVPPVPLDQAAKTSIAKK